MLFNSLTAISLLLALATAGLWVRSEFFVATWRYVQVRSTSDASYVKEYLLRVDRGTIDIGREDAIWEFPNQGRTSWSHSARPIEDEIAEGRRRHWLPSFGSFPHHMGELWQVALPLWILLLLSMVLPAARTVAVRRRIRLSSDLYCPSCGYDCRANGERCSECGTEIASSTKTVSL